MKKLSLLVFTSILFMGFNLNAQNKKEESKIHAEHLTVETFKEKVFDFENNEEWMYKGNVPCIVDFYADWCKPCKMVAPIMEELANEYDGKLKVYKVNTDKQKQLSQVFGIRSIPAVLFVPMEGKPQMSTGALPKQTFEQVITEFLLVEKPK